MSRYVVTKDYHVRDKDFSGKKAFVKGHSCRKIQTLFFIAKWCMFLIAAQQRFGISLASGTGTQPDFLEYRSGNLELNFKSKIYY